MGIIAAAAAYAGLVFYKKTRSAVKKTGCGADCGCNGKSR